MKTVLVTGGSRGLGSAFALAFGKAGYRVAVNYSTSKAPAEKIVEQLPEAMAIECDVRDSLRVRQMVDAVRQKWGTLDLLINNAGITRDQRLLKMSNGEWNDVIDVNLNGVFWCMREAARLMADQKSGHIINIASRLAYVPVEGASNYAASKAAVIALTQAAARELGRYHVRVNAVLPGFHETEMGLRLPPKARERIQSDHLLGYSTRLEDVTRFVVQLAQNESVSGQVFNVDNRMIG